MLTSPTIVGRELTCVFAIVALRDEKRCPLVSWIVRAVGLLLNSFIASFRNVSRLFCDAHNFSSKAYRISFTYIPLNVRYYPQLPHGYLRLYSTGQKFQS
jgi:hypothetical protein